MNAINKTTKLTTGLILAGLALTSLVTIGCDEQAADLTGKSEARSRLIFISSARFKTNVVTVSDALAKIEQLRGVTFDYKPEYGEPNQLGFIAEEAAAVLPQAVVRDSTGRPIAMDYVAVVPVTVEAIKQLSAESAAMRTENAELRQRLATLESAIQALNTQPQR